VDPERGELVRPVSIVPPAAVNLADNVFIFPNGKPQKVQAQVRANIAKAAGEVRLEVENGWKAEPQSRPFQLAEAGEQADLSFEITPAPGDRERAGPADCFGNARDRLSAYSCSDRVSAQRGARRECRSYQSGEASRLRHGLRR
jgi:hypothetical protein